MKQTMILLTVLILGGYMPLRAQSLLEELQSDPNVTQALSGLNAAFESTCLQGPMATLEALSSNPQAQTSFQALQNAQNMD